MEEYLDLECCEMCGNNDEDELTMNNAGMIICHYCQFELECGNMMNQLNI